ncbi:hypothetical protein, partial [Burkholderia pseudomallei]|uniref:hypothetical protein n=1 Tax=Burkholderia pseudomallei TaxID=28450 RepID=UPI0019402D7C
GFLGAFLPLGGGWRARGGGGGGGLPLFLFPFFSPPPRGPPGRRTNSRPSGRLFFCVSLSRG